MTDNSLRNGLAEHRALARAANSAFDGTSNKTSGVKLDENFRPESELKFKAARFFRRIVADAPAGHFITTDAPLLVEYCVLLAKLDALRNDFTDSRATVTTVRGDMRPHPVVVVYTKLQHQAAVFAEKLRLQPLGRRAAGVHGEHRSKNKDDDGDDKPSQEDQTPSRSGLMFGGARVAASVIGEEGSGTGS